MRRIMKKQQVPKTSDRKTHINDVDHHGGGDDGEVERDGQKNLRRSKRCNSLELQGKIVKKAKVIKEEDGSNNSKKKTQRKRLGTPAAGEGDSMGTKKEPIERNTTKSERPTSTKTTTKRKVTGKKLTSIEKEEKKEDQNIHKSRKKIKHNVSVQDEQRPNIGSKVKEDYKEDNNKTKEEESALKKEDDGSDDDSDNDDWEEVEDLSVIESPVKVTGSDNKTIEITLDTPNQTKKKNKEELWEDYFRREINRYNREKQIAIHKVNLLCLLALGHYRTNVCSDPLLQALCMSVIPNKFTDSDHLDIAFLVRFVRWFQSQFKINSTIKKCNVQQFDEVLRSRFDSFEVANETELVYIFASMLQCIQLCVRIILSLHPVSLKSSQVIKKPSQKSCQDGETSTSKNVSKSDTKPAKKAKQELSTKENNERKQNSLASSRKTKNLLRRKNASKVTGKIESSNEVIDISQDDNNSEGEMKLSSDLDSDEDWTKVRKRTRKKKANSGSTTMNSDSNFQPDVMDISKSRKKKSKVSEVTLSDSDEDVKVIGEVGSDSLTGSDVWVEVFHETEGKWICIDCIRGIINHPEKCESYATQPMHYVLSFYRDGSIKDLTKKYASKWMTHTRKQRIDHIEPKWWLATLKPFRTKDEDNEDEQLQANLLNKPMPTSVSEFKNHPLYALKRHLLKFEAIYPESATILGYCRGEAVYSRECVHELHAKEAWIKEARVVRIGEKPYKLVKARPKPHQRKTGEVPPPLPIYGYWQTEEYMAPPAVDGKVPRNEHGNVELYKPCMLPVGTVHLKIPGLNKVARKLDIDCAPAMVGWDFHCGYSHPVFDGFIVCEEFQEMLVDAWQKEQLEIEKKNSEKRELRVLKNWKKLSKGLIIKERLKRRFQSSFEESGLQDNEQEKADDVTMAWPLNRNMQESKDDDTHLFPFEKL